MINLSELILLLVDKKLNNMWYECKFDNICIIDILV